MLSTAQESLLERFKEGLKFDGYDDYYVRAIAADFDSKPHAQAWQGRFLLLSGSVKLEIGGRTFEYTAGQGYQVPADAVHREIFGPGGTQFVIARQRAGRPLPVIAGDVTPVSLR